MKTLTRIPFVELDLGLGFLICNCFACCSFKSLLCKVFEGGMQDLIFIHFPFCICLVALFFFKVAISMRNLSKLRSEAMQIGSGAPKI